MILWTKIAARLLLPPGGLVTLAVLGFALRLRWRALGGAVIGASIAALLMLSIPLAAITLIRPLESRFPPLAPTLTARAARAQAGAIVVLGGGRYADAPEYGNTDTVGGDTLERLRYAAELARRTGLPLLVSGGAPFAEAVPEADLMNAVLQRDFGLTARWTETRSRNTFENARYTRDRLRGSGVASVYLVTNAWHMPRAVWSFETVGLKVIPAPMGFSTLGRSGRGPLGFLPAAQALRLSSLALHERLGMLWYEWRYGPVRRSRSRPFVSG